MTNEEILSDPEIELVLDTTYGVAHDEVNTMILRAGKHVYSEKTLAHSFEAGKALCALAAEKGLRVGAAPDTFLGAGYQTCRKLLDSGMIGQPVTAQVMVQRGYGTESSFATGWPGGLFVPGASIPFDMGGYYIHAIVSLLGAVRRVGGFSTHRPRTYTNPAHPLYKKDVPISAPTILSAALEFDCGVLGTLTVSSESFGETTRVEIYGTEGTLICPDPNVYGGDIWLVRKGGQERVRMPYTHGFGDIQNPPPTFSGKPEPGWNSRRGVGAADMAYAIRSGRPHRANGEIGLHTLEIIDAVERACAEDKIITLTTRPERPAPLAPGWTGADEEGVLDI